MDVSLFSQQLDEIISVYEVAIAKSEYDDGSDMLKKHDVVALQSRCMAAAERIAGKASTYSAQMQLVLQTEAGPWNQLSSMVGVAKALSHDLTKGYLRSFEELIHSSIFADFLEMADYLADNGYKDASAVVAGSTLEGHLRKMALKAGIAVSSEKGSKSAGTLNAEIAKAGGYSKLEEKNVTAWLHLRNSAAHGRYNEYNQDQVKMLISGVREFVARSPA